MNKTLLLFSLFAGASALAAYFIFSEEKTPANSDDGTGTITPDASQPTPVSGIAAAAAAAIIARRYGKKKFLEELAPLIAKLNTVGPDSVAIAQAALESGWASKGVYLRTNNLFGITENRPGRPAYVASSGLKFRVYGSLEESILDRNTFLQSKRYTAFRNSKGYKLAAEALEKSGYAGNAKGYANAIIRIIEDNHLYLYDSI